jgi:hypothetical protein
MNVTTGLLQYRCRRRPLEQGMTLLRGENGVRLSTGHRRSHRIVAIRGAWSRRPQPQSGISTEALAA